MAAATDVQADATQAIHDATSGRSGGQGSIENLQKDINAEKEKFKNDPASYNAYLQAVSGQIKESPYLHDLTIVFYHPSPDGNATPGPHDKIQPGPCPDGDAKFGPADKIQLEPRPDGNAKPGPHDKIQRGPCPDSDEKPVPVDTVQREPRPDGNVKPGHRERFS